MEIITAEDYRRIIGAAEVPDTFELSVTIAVSTIDALCGGRISAIWPPVDPEVKEAIQQAAAVQVAHMDAVGGALYAASGSAAVSGASIGKFSYTESQTAAASKVCGVSLAPAVEVILMRTGLLYRGCNVCG